MVIDWTYDNTYQFNNYRGIGNVVYSYISTAALAAAAVFETDAASPPTTETARIGKILASGEHIDLVMTVVIKAGDYYRLRQDVASAEILKWIEYSVVLT